MNSFKLFLNIQEKKNIILGNMNFKIGKEKVGCFGPVVRNEKGKRLIQFCREMKYTIMNTFLKLPSRFLYTWKSTADNHYKIGRNEIDFVIISRKYRKPVASCETYPGDIP